MTFYLNKIIELIEREDIDQILNQYHLTLAGGHLGGGKMYNTSSRFYKWNNMMNEIKDLVLPIREIKKCPICEKTKTH